MNDCSRCGHRWMLHGWQTPGADHKLTNPICVAVKSSTEGMCRCAELEPIGRTAAMTDEQHPEPDPEPDELAVEPADGQVWTRERLRSARSKAQARAKTRLSHEYRMRYVVLYALELEREGLSVLRPHRTGIARARTAQREQTGPLPYEPVDVEGVDRGADLPDPNQT